MALGGVAAYARGAEDLLRAGLVFRYLQLTREMLLGITCWRRSNRVNRVAQSARQLNAHHRFTAFPSL
jgi:hypothetical protein